VLQSSLNYYTWVNHKRGKLKEAIICKRTAVNKSHALDRKIDMLAIITKLIIRYYPTDLTFSLEYHICSTIMKGWYNWLNYLVALLLILVQKVGCNNCPQRSKVLLEHNRNVTLAVAPSYLLVFWKVFWNMITSSNSWRTYGRLNRSKSQIPSPRSSSWKWN
jgi:hypothetical protein